MQKIKYSIILPVYNGEEFVHRAIESVINQEYPYFELIIVNDGSTDRTLEVCQKYNDRRISIIEKDNSGVSDSRNMGIERAKGDYILFLDADDKFLDNALQVVDDEISKCDADLYCFAYDEIQDGNIISKRECNKYGDYSSVEEINKLIVFSLRQSQWYSDDWYGNFRPVWNKCFKKKTIEDSSIRFERNLRIGEDMAFVISVLNRSTRVILTERKYYQYINNSNSVMHSRTWCGSQQSELYLDTVKKNTIGRAEESDLRELWLETAENDWITICNSPYSLKMKLNYFSQLLKTNDYVRFSKKWQSYSSKKEAVYLWCIRNRFVITLFILCSIRTNIHSKR